MTARFFFFLYTLGIRTGNLFIYISHFINAKIRLMYNGRRSTLDKIKSKPSDFEGCIWIHCASLGEFEQGRPLIEQIKLTHPDKKILVSFFSPSGYEIRKNYPQADEIIYLPSDLPTNNRKLLDYYKPVLFILVKYEFWWNLIAEIQHRKIPIYLVSGVFRAGDYFLKPWLISCQYLLNKFNTIFVQDIQSCNVLKKHNINHVIQTGDTRIDRVLDNVGNVVIPEKLKRVTLGKQVIVYGSVWKSDMSIVSTVMTAFPDFIHIVAPHDIHPVNIDKILEQIPIPSRLYSDVNLDKNVIIINNIGMLSSIYRLANFVYIGGGFGKGIHNILEPAVFRVPVFFGPNHKKFNEAVTLVSKNAAFCIHHGESMVAYCIKILNDKQYSSEIADRLVQYFNQNRGATHKILSHLKLNNL